MAYIRWGEILPSRKRSEFYVIGDDVGIYNVGTGKNGKV